MGRRKTDGVWAVRQGVSTESVFEVIKRWCERGAGQKTYCIRIMSAFASGRGVSAIAPLLDVFLSGGNRIEIIIGIDRGGTDLSAIAELHAIAEAYHTQSWIRVFHAPSKSAIFHPKLYVLKGARTQDIMLGSANLTGGGLASNFESAVIHREIGHSAPIAQQADWLWSTFANPVPPLRADYLRGLSKRYVRELARKLPAVVREAGGGSSGASRDLWRPLSSIPLQGSERPGRAARQKMVKSRSSLLLMDILQETRQTQVQLPLAIVREFLGVDPESRASFQVQIWTHTGLSHPLERTLVISQGPERARLMRRIEIPPIEGLERPLAIVFARSIRSGRLVYRVLRRDTPEYRQANRLLERHGQQGNGVRRYIIGDAAPSATRKAIASLMPAHH